MDDSKYKKYIKWLIEEKVRHLPSPPPIGSTHERNIALKLAKEKRYYKEFLIWESEIEGQVMLPPKKVEIKQNHSLVRQIVKQDMEQLAGVVSYGEMAKILERRLKTNLPTFIKASQISAKAFGLTIEENEQVKIPAHINRHSRIKLIRPTPEIEF